MRSLLAWRPVHKVAPRTNLFTFVCSETVVEGGECLPLDSDIPRSSILDTSVRAPLLTHGAAATLYAPAFSRSSLSLYLVSPKCRPGFQEVAQRLAYIEEDFRLAWHRQRQLRTAARFNAHRL